MAAQKSPYANYWSRIYALPHNHFFRDRVQQYRAQLGIPSDGISDLEGAKEWYGHYVRSHPLRVFPVQSEGGNEFTKIEPLDGALSLREDPLENAALRLLREFDLPEDMAMAVAYFIVTDISACLTSWEPLKLSFEYGISKRWSLEMSPVFNVHVRGMTPLTTKEEWIGLWEQISATNETFDKVLGSAPSLASVKGRRPARGRALEERIKRYAEWYELSELQGLGPSRALDVWESRHPEISKRYDVSAVAKAVSQFNSLIQPRQTVMEL